MHKLQVKVLAELLFCFQSFFVFVLLPSATSCVAAFYACILQQSPPRLFNSGSVVNTA
jgi:hypothetical protein